MTDTALLRKLAETCIAKIDTDNDPWFDARDGTFVSCPPAEFIAAASPQAIIDLLDKIELIADVLPRLHEAHAAALDPSPDEPGKVTALLDRAIAKLEKTA